MKKPHLSLVSVCVGAFLLPLIGGHMSLDAARIPSDSNLLQSILAGNQAPFLTQFVISLFFLFPLLIAMFTRKVIHVPNVRVTGWLAVFFGCIAVSLLWTSFWLPTLQGILQWIMMAMAFFAVTANAGKKQSIWVLFAFFAGTSLAAAAGILEYGQERLIDPGYRIYALQGGQNQAGALFAACSLLGVTLIFRVERLGKLLIAIGIVLQGLAMVLTQSKGAILCLPLGLAVLLVGLAILKPVPLKQAILAALVPFLLVGLLAVGAQQAARSTKQANTNAPMSRFSNSSEAATQSAGFRKLLWLSAVDLMKKQPQGWGMNSYWYEGTRTGRMTQTALAHQTFLQLGAEASPIAAITLLGFVVAVILRASKGIRRAAEDTQLVYLGSLAVMVVSIAHNMIDSDMYIFGLGSMVFLLLGCMTSSSADSQAPEVIFPIPRYVVAGIAMMLAPMVLIIGMGEYYRAVARGAIAERNPSLAESSLKQAIGIMPLDGTAYAMLGLISRNENDLIKAAHLIPSPKNCRALANYYFALNRPDEAFSPLRKALLRDPNNAPALLLFMNGSERTGNIPTAIEYAKKLVATENSTYFQVRSQAELIPTQTYEARIFLARQSSDPNEKLKLLVEATKGYLEFTRLTVPVIKRNTSADLGINFAGEDRVTAAEKVEKGRAAAVEIQRLAVKDPTFDPDAAVKLFDAALLDLRSQ